MKYFFLVEKSGTTSVVVAKTLENAEDIAKKSKCKIKNLYELLPDTFKDEGFLITWK